MHKVSLTPLGMFLLALIDSLLQKEDLSPLQQKYFSYLERLPIYLVTSSVLKQTHYFWLFVSTEKSKALQLKAVWFFAVIRCQFELG